MKIIAYSNITMMLGSILLMARPWRIMDLNVAHWGNLSKMDSLVLKHYGDRSLIYVFQTTFIWLNTGLYCPQPGMFTDFFHLFVPRTSSEDFN